MSGPLDGQKVIDLSRVLAGPWASQLLADFGADVIKVERPGSGDDTRRWGPPWLKDAAGMETGDSAYFLAANRNKRSITVNLAHPDGQSLLRDLADSADILLENFRVGTLARFGLDYASLSARNERLIYCSISAFGQTGSRAGRPGYDAMMQAAGGLMSITGPAEAEGGGPQKVGVAVADLMTGMYASNAILAALEARHRTGNGQFIDISLYDCQVAWLANQAMNYLVGGEIPQRQGTAHPNIVPYQAFATADGHLMLAVGNDQQFRACCRCLGREALADDARFATNARRVEHRAMLVDLLATEFARRGTCDWLEALAAEQVPAGPINDIGEVLSEPYAAERELVRHLDHVRGGSVPTVSNPIRFSRTPVGYELAPPELGQHTEEVLSEDLGYSAEKIRSLRDAGAI